MRSGKTYEGEKFMHKYVNGMKYSIQNELILSRFKILREAYKLALKSQENLTKNTNIERGKIVVIWRGGKVTSARGQSSGKKREENSEVRRYEGTTKNSILENGRGGVNPIGRGNFGNNEKPLEEGMKIDRKYSITSSMKLSIRNMSS